MKYLAKTDNSSEMSQFIKTDGVWHTVIFMIDDYICEIRNHKNDLPYTVEHIQECFVECKKSEFDNALNKALNTLKNEF